MKEIRSSKSSKAKEIERKRNTERRYLQRLIKRTGLQYKISDCIDINQHNFNVYMKSLVWQECHHCHRKVIQSCFTKYKCHKNCKLFGPDNDMDPLDVPDQLQNLTYIEKQLIARVHSVISLYKFKKCQYKYKGQVINFSQDVQSVADRLPHLIENLDNVVVVKLQNSVSAEDFVVRKNKVLNALIWLKGNNPYYSDLVIDYQNLDSLPENANVFDRIKKISTLDEDGSISGDDITDDDTDIVFTHVPDSLSPSVKKSFNNTLIWPSLGTTPINEFSSPSYISLCFPHLFPYGKGDYTVARPYKVKLSDYIHHLMLYKDERFSKDERFRYFMMNSHMRWTSLNLGNVYVRKNTIFSKMTIIQLKEYFQSNPWIADQIMHFGSRLRTTKSYWNSRCSELLDMVHQVGTPTVFFTLSSADYHWPDLYRLLGHDVSSLSAKEKANLISQNPLIADTFFYLRSKYFLEKCFKNQFDVDDIWYRYEFQHRGSIHLHGLAWFKDAPIIKDNMTPEEKITVTQYFDKLISCENPDITILPATTHPCQLSLDQVQNIDSDLCQLVNHVQRHTKCSKAHCLRPVGNSKALECRYKFPRELVPETYLEMQEDKVVDINFKRNDPLVNKYNKWILQTWRSNIDISPILNKEIVYRYIAKYTSKSEVKSLCYNEVLSEILNKSSDEGDLSKKAIRKLLTTSCAERDYCAQEVMHYLMGYHFYGSSREFVVVNLRNTDWSSISSFGSSKSVLERYADRKSCYEKLSLFQIAKYFKPFDNELVLRKKPAIVRFFPRCVKQRDEDKFYTYMSQIFYPWRSVDDIADVNEDMKLYIDQLYEMYMKSSVSEMSNVNPLEPINLFTPDTPGKDKESILSSYNPHKGIEKNVPNLSDLNDYQWDYMSERISRETIQVVNEKIQQKVQKKTLPTVDITALNTDQLQVFAFIKTLADNITQGKDVKGVFGIVQGMPGTGKTYLLKCCVQYITTCLGENYVKVIAPTGVAAKLVNGTTLHSFLSLGRFGFHTDRLSGLELLNFKEKHKGIRFLFVDEYSMLGLRMLACMEMRCRDLSDSEDIFGNLIFIMFGDANQLLPVCDQPLYAEISNLSRYNNLLEKGKALMTQLSKAFVLSICHRFANDEYISFLKKIGHGTCSKREMKFINERCLVRLTLNERKWFEKTLRVCSTNESTNDHNIQELDKVSRPIAIIKAENNNKTAFLSSDDAADGLCNVLSLCRNAKVMLKRNLSVNRGLVNGSIGVIKHIVYESGQRPPALPLCLLILFESVDLEDLNIRYVPITPICTTWYRSGVLCSRIQLPVVLCWACTIHKAQGLSLTAMMLDAGKSEFALGLLYVALSRVPDKESLCLVVSLTLDRLNSVKKSSRFVIRKKFLKMLRKMSLM